jgi:multicomponent K+:H+ antiporter subunit E
MKRILPFPLLSLALLITWLLLNQSLGVGHVLLGALLGLCGSWVTAALLPATARVRRPGAMLRLSVLVLIDIVRSNIAVARIILSPGGTRHSSGFVAIPLELRAPYGLAVLACIITATPGTLWADFDSGEGMLTIHVLDLIDEDAWIRIIKNRYERLLMEIFE